MLRDSLSSGELVPLLTDYESDRVDIHVLYPVALRNEPRIRLYVEAVRARLAADVPR